MSPVRTELREDGAFQCESPSHNSYQIQCMDTNEGSTQFGAMIPYGVPVFIHESDLEAIKRAYKPTGEWRLYEILCQGETVVVQLNGVTVTTASTIKNLEGHIGIQGEHGLLEFRKIEIAQP